MKKLIILKGLPASGKSTWAKAQVANNPGKYKRINKDMLRAMLDESHWTNGNEKFILDVRDRLVLMALADGKHVIIDDTNLDPKHEEQLRKMVEGQGVEVQVKVFGADVDTCVARDAVRVGPDKVGEKVIRNMHNRYLKPPDPPPPVFNPALPRAIIIDIDGTLALHNGRGPHDTSLYHTDTLNKPVANIVQLYEQLEEDVWVLVVTGRDATFRQVTSDWLSKNQIFYNQLLMRPEGDKRRDDLVKRELYDQHIKDKYNVLFVLDDRDRVVAMWRSLGLTCLQVALGDF